MHSLRASVLFIIIAVSAFLADNRRVQPPVQPQPEELVSSAAVPEAEIPDQQGVLVAEKKQPAKKKRTRIR